MLPVGWIETATRRCSQRASSARELRTSSSAAQRQEEDPSHSNVPSEASDLEGDHSITHYDEHGRIHGIQTHYVCPSPGVRLYCTIPWVHGERCGVEKWYDAATQRVVREIPWASSSPSVRHGFERRMFGDVVHTIPWKLGRRNGVETKCHATTHVVFYTCEWHDGEKHGAEVLRRPDGTIVDQKVHVSPAVVASARRSACI